ncbi:MAG: class I SAM-dependent RNA methyltransferase [Defluviitaleaceae bacterium]|nr:class I SAM-dependent RNA methyltransferase [Defluviitaleaceae bacterium]MCL2263395.1 class I SAM-dependent RNA methyltransferase [Defluviitaleaceae bacterium]
MQSLIATAAFGLEAVVKREVTALGFDDITCLDSKVEFTSQNLHEGIVRANLWLRSADRVLLKMGEFTATTFDELFEKTKALPWAEWIPQEGKFTVTGKSVKSGLYSVPDVQSIVKKAVVDKLRQKYRTDWFKETGAEYTIQAAILKDVVTLTIDTTGAKNGLHKRGYRARATRAPMKETMAAALIELARYNGKKPFLDPCCGSGTLPIEAALMAKNIAPGLARKFACEKWQRIPEKLWKEERAAAYAKIKTDCEPIIHAADIDPDAVELAQANAELAGVDDCIIFENRPLSQTVLPSENGIAIINPPYGERLGAIKEAEALYSELGRIFNPTRWNVYVITPDEFFETAYKKKARAKRKLFNGMIKTDYYQFF